MQIVSYETALKLAERDFPQPKIAVRQFWYNKHRELLQIVNKGEIAAIHPDTGFEGWLYYSTANEAAEIPQESAVFAPTATDILSEMREGYVIRRDGNMFVVETDGYMTDTEYVSGYECARNENLAEALAVVWQK